MVSLYDVVGPHRHISHVDEQYVQEIESKFIQDGHIRLMPASAWQALDPTSLAVWCNRRAIYGIPTVELILWIKGLIAGRTALEIGAGNGDLGYHLGIPATDSHVQWLNQSVLDYYYATKQAPTVPVPGVATEDAENAVRKNKPDVVIASWVTAKYEKGAQQGNMYGPREEYIIDRCKMYVFVGNSNVHTLKNKRVLNIPHETFQFPWLVSRASDQTKNVVHVWKNNKHY